jgi:hypothetical protein
MDARILRVVVLAAAVCCIGASHRTTNFIVQAPDAQFARQVGEAAEQFRSGLAIEWLGHELPRWSQPCPITVQVGPNLGAGGATSFMFQNGRPFGWRMSIQGSARRILDSVLPHEVTHTIFATYFGRPLPRWADEGACTTVEHGDERSKQEKLLVQFLSTRRGIAFNRMFVMTEYPTDILPLYAQGYSLARYLIAQGGKQKFVEYVGDGMRSGDWTSATGQHYGFKDLSDLQVTWLEWVRGGSQPLQGREPELLVDNRSATPPNQAFAAASHNELASHSTDLVPVPPSSDSNGNWPSSTRGYQDSWYQRQRDRGRSSKIESAASDTCRDRTREDVALASTYSAPPKSLSRPQSPQTSGERVIDWGPVSVTAPSDRPSRSTSGSTRPDASRYGESPRYDAIPHRGLKLSEGGTVWR